MIPERSVLAVVAALNARRAYIALNLSPRADRGEKGMSKSTPQMSDLPKAGAEARE